MNEGKLPPKEDGTPVRTRLTTGVHNYIVIRTYYGV